MFSLLEKDDKTRYIINAYVDYFGDKYHQVNMSLFCFDQEIQHKEIVDHCNNNGLDINDPYVKIDWIEVNGKAYRIYLNSCKQVALEIEKQIIMGLKRELICLNSQIDTHNDKYYSGDINNLPENLN